jgi:hypothetical protein
VGVNIDASGPDALNQVSANLAGVQMDGSGSCKPCFLRRDGLNDVQSHPVFRARHEEIARKAWASFS